MIVEYDLNPIAYYHQLDQFHSYMEQKNFNGREFKYFQMKGHAFFHKEENGCKVNIHGRLLKFIKSTSQEAFSPFQPNLAQCVLVIEGLKYVEMKDHTFLQR